MNQFNLNSYEYSLDEICEETEARRGSRHTVTTWSHVTETAKHITLSAVREGVPTAMAELACTALFRALTGI